MNLIGKLRPGVNVDEVPANYKRVGRYMTPVVETMIVKLTLYCDGLGSGAGDQVLRGVIYDTRGNLIAQGDEIVVRDGQAPGWVDLPFTTYPGGVPLLPGVAYDFGFLAGDRPNTVRVYGDPSAGF